MLMACWAENREECILPKKDGVTKTYSFSRNTVDMLDKICKYEHRTQTNLIELLIMRRHSELSKELEGEMLNGKTAN